MIVRTPYEKNVYRENYPGENIKYYGESVHKIEEISEDLKNDVIKNLGKQCTTYTGKRGVIIGFEDCRQYQDLYYIVYVPETNKVEYPLAYDQYLINTIC